MFRPTSDTFRGIFGLPEQNQNESLQKTDCCNVCQIVDRKSVAPSSGDFRLQPAPRYVCGQDQEFFKPNIRDQQEKVVSRPKVLL